MYRIFYISIKHAVFLDHVRVVTSLHLYVLHSEEL